MAKVILILIVALVLEATGVVFLSAGLKEIGELNSFSTAEVARVVRRGAANPKLLLGVALEAVFFVLLLILLKDNDVSLIWPLTSLGFVLTALSAKFILQEQVSPVRWCGVLLIVLGATLVSWSEKQKGQKPDRPRPPASTSLPGAE
jgi:drug/metabolite transporter (DMT)-like permease